MGAADDVPDFLKGPYWAQPCPGALAVHLLQQQIPLALGHETYRDLAKWAATAMRSTMHLPSEDGRAPSAHTLKVREAIAQVLDKIADDPLWDFMPEKGEDGSGGGISLDSLWDDLSDIFGGKP